MNDCYQPLYINFRTLSASTRLALGLLDCLHPYENPPVFLCIGSDRVTGDSLGPLVGSFLEKRYPDTAIFGTLTLPVHALNLNEHLRYIREKFPLHPVIAIDASLGARNRQGYLTVGRGSIRPGAGVHKNLEQAGDIFITGIVAAAGPFSQMALQTVRLSVVMDMAEIILEGIEKTALIRKKRPNSSFSSQCRI